LSRDVFAKANTSFDRIVAAVLRRNTRCYAFLIEAMQQKLGTRHPQLRAGAVGGTFRLEGEYWTIAYNGIVCRLRDTAGLRCIAHLLRRPSEKVAATELARMAPKSGASGEARDGRTATGNSARVKATRSIRTAMQRIGTHNAPLIEHLRATIKTGTSCSYTPDPRLPVDWEF
jgi:hypothetical protein